MSSKITPVESYKTSPLTEENIRKISEDDHAQRVDYWVEALPDWSPHKEWQYIRHLLFYPLPYYEEEDRRSRTYSEEHFVPHCERTGTSDWGEDEEEEEYYPDEDDVDEVFYRVVDNNAWTLMWE
ncbi:hypothetical protein Neosp_013839 [[Neocosmospora] mangrovei]